MATFVLVHGAWHGGWCWKRVTPLLRAAGHEVYAPTLTGLGERAHLLSRDVNLDTHIHDVVNLLDCEELTDVVLVGHSYAGIVIAGVATQRPGRVAHLVYLDAFVVRDGQSLEDLHTPEAVAGRQARVLAEGEGWRLPPPATVALRRHRRGRWGLARVPDRPAALRDVHPARAPGRHGPARRNLHLLLPARGLPPPGRAGARRTRLAVPRARHRP